MCTLYCVCPYIDGHAQLSSGSRCLAVWSESSSTPMSDVCEQLRSASSSESSHVTYIRTFPISRLPMM